MNDILIPKFREVFELSSFQAMFVQSAFFGAFFVISLIYFILSISGIDLIAKYGYKKAIIVGLVVAAIGCFLFYIAATKAESFNLCLVALFVLASGVTILQMGANPYVSLLGKPEGASSRLNMTQAFNSLGTTVAPIVGGILIFSCASQGSEHPLDTVEIPYIGLTVTLIALAVFIFFADLPTINSEESGKIEKGKGAFAYSHLVLGVICIFMYVGGEVSIGSTIINYLGLKDVANLPNTEADKFLAVYWGGAMIGRFFAAIFLNEDDIDIKEKLGSILGILGFGIILAIFLTNKEIILSSIIKPCPGAALHEWDFHSAFIFIGVVVANIVAFLIGKKKPGFTLGIFALIVCLLLGVVTLGSGYPAMWSILVIGLFNSIMFPTIFTLAIKGLGIDTAQGASLLVMAIVGGAIIPLAQGKIEDITGSLHVSFIVPFICYLYIAYYGFIGSKVKK
jgi:MFS transporter, FHS family, L-fucose permease